MSASRFNPPVNVFVCNVLLMVYSSYIIFVHLL
nr:MAG TPA: hypothetical protein [Caudoviricetes sp.]